MVEIKKEVQPPTPEEGGFVLGKKARKFLDDYTYKKYAELTPEIEAGKKMFNSKISEIGFLWQNFI